MDYIKYILALGLLLHCSTASPFERTKEIVQRTGNESYRLPYTVLPKLYEIKLTPDIPNFNFTGDVKITFSTNKTDVNSITLHAKDLHNIKITSSDLTDITYEFVSDYDFIVISFNGALIPERNYVLRFEYDGFIRDDMTGFYRSYYMETGVKKWLATTQFQPTEARKAFPCFDEPLYKAEFELEFNCPEGYYCRSNMKAIGNEQGPSVRFERTPIMSTYILAFVVSDFIPARESNETDTLRILARPQASTMGDFAFTTARKLQEHMDKYFNLSYYGKHDNLKLDHVAIPDFSAGAMENWGLVTYREALLMYAENDTPISYKQRIANILTHEILHMWFGNYITTHWWSDTWLNEGFARFYQFFATDKVFSDDEKFGLEDQYTVTQIHPAMVVDTAPSSVPMTNPNVNTPAEVMGQFSTISYSKASAIIRMVQHWIGDNNYVMGLQELLKKKALDVFVPDDLFAALQGNRSVDLSGLTVKDLMESWSSVAGFPILNVEIDRLTNRMILNQKRFLRPNQTDSTIYNIPITFTKQGSVNFEDTKPAFIMDRSQMNRSEIISGWVIFNIQQTGYYRVNYDEETWKLIIQVLNSPNRTLIHRYNRAQIIDDAFNLAREGVIKYSQMFEIIQFLEFESDYSPWTAAFAGFNFMRMHFGKIESISKKLDHHISKLMETLMDEIGLDDKGLNLVKLFRGNSLRFACNLGHQACINSSVEWFEGLRNNSIASIPPNLRETVYCNALRHGDLHDYEFLWYRHLATNIVSEKELIIGAMGCTNNSILINRYLMETLKPNTEIRDQDRMTAFNSALNGNPTNVEVTKDFVFRNVAEIRNVYGTGNLQTMFSNIASRLSREELTEMDFLLDFTSGLTAVERTSGKNSIQNAINMMDWAEGFEDEISTWLEDKYNSSTHLTASIALVCIMLFTLVLNK